MTTTPPQESIKQSVDDQLAAHLRAALLALPAEVVEGGAWKIVKRDGKTFGYVAFEASLRASTSPTDTGSSCRSGSRA